MIKRFYILLLAIVASVGMSFAQASIVSSGTKGGMSYTFYDNGLLEISGSGALPGRAFTNWDGGFGTSVKNIRFAEDCEVYGLGDMWFGCYTETSQLETIEINSVVPIMFSGASGEGIFYQQDGAVTLTITAPGIVDVEGEIIGNYGSPVNMIFNLPATTVFEKKWFSGLRNNFAVTIPTGAKGHIPAGYVFTDSYNQDEYDHLVADGHEDLFWRIHSDLVEGVDYTLGVESSFVITAENASQIFGQAAVSFQAPTEASNSEWVLWRKSDLKTFSDMSSGDQKVYKDVTVKVNNGVYNTDSGWGIHFESLGEDGVQFVAPEGKVFKRIVIFNEYGTFSDPNWSYDGNYKKWSGSADTVGFVGNICGISLIEFELEASAPANACGDGLTWELNGGALTISYTGTGTGVMDNYASMSDAPWYSHKDDITSVTITDGVKSVGSYSFGYYGNLVTVTIGNDVETIGYYAFGDCYKFTTLNLGNSVKHIGDRAFMWAKVLTGFTLPSTLETIGERAFLQNKLITSLTIPSNVTSIGPSAFMYCAALTSVTVEATTPPTLGATVFDGVPTSSIPLHVPSGSVAAYTAADQWKDFDIQDPTPAYETVMNLINAIGTVELTAECKAKIDAARTAYDALSDGDKALVTNSATLTTAEEAFENVMNIWLSGDCDAILWKDTTLTVRKHAGEGNGAMADYTDYYGDNTAPWFNSHWYNPQPGDIVIKSVTIEEGVTRIGDYAFGWMSELKTITIPSSVTSIGEDAFYWSKAVDDIYLTANPSNLTWVLPYSADNQFKPEKGTRCHVPADLLTAYQEKFGTLNMTFVGDLDPITPLTPEQQQALDAAKDKIAAIPSPVVYTPACKDAIDAARAAYDALTPDMLKQLVGNYATLTAAEATYANLKDVAVAEAKIAAIPQPVTLKLATRDSIESARAAYDALTADQKLLVSNYAILEAAEATMATLNPGGDAPDGAVSGKFSIDESSVVYFSKGNLQATTADLGANWTWSFAANQWDYIGNVAANNAISGNGTVSANGTVDLFGWSTSTTKYGIHNGTNSNISDYAGDFVDWGTTMGDGWFTLSKEQWHCLLNTRTGDKAATVNSVADCRYAKATINTDGTAAKGIILFPDGGTFAASEFTEVGSPNTEDANYTTTCTTAQWNALQAKGCVFLPAAGRRYGAEVSTEDPNGYYWSSSPKPSTGDAYYVFFYSYGMYAPNDFRCLGLSVRLVTEAPASPLAAAQAVKDLIEAIPAEITLEDACVNAVQAARDAYNALSDAAKGALDDATVQKLNQAITDYTALIQAGADEVIAKINNIPQPVELKLATRDSINNARAAYDALTADQQALVSNYQTLLDAEATMATLNPGGGMPADALNGKFTINAGGDQIAFAKGNLQATTEDLGEHWTWSFAANQWNYLGIAVANNKISGNKTVSENGTVDLFGWSTAATYYGINNSYKAVDYIGDFVDWGSNMGAGWRTLTKDEWAYLLQHSSNGKATVNDKNGYIFLPDNWSGPAFTANPDNFTTNVYSGDDWTAMENAGAVFLPSGPARNGIYALIANDAKYCSSTSLNNDTSYVFTIYYNQSQSACTGTNRAYGCMVRLVSEGGGATPLDSAQVAKDLIEAIPAEITLDAACVNAVQAARDAYNALTEATKGALDPAIVNKLTDAEAALTALNQAVADEVIAKINAIPTPVELKLATRDSIESARAAYDALTTAQQDLVTNYQKLLDAEAALAALVPTPTPVPGTPTVWDMNELKVGDIIYEGDQLTIMSSPRYFNDETIREDKCPYTLMKSAGETSYVLKDKDGSYLLTDGSLAITPTSVGLLVTSVKSGDINVVVYSLANVLDSAQAVKDLIDAIPTPVEYPTSGPAIAAALVAYQQLSDAAKGALDDADVQKMTDAATQYAALDAIAAIEAIPAEIVYDPAVKAAIETAREKYDALIDASKALVDDEVVAKLTNAEQAWADLVALIEHTVSYIGKDGELKNEKVALLHIPNPAPDFNGHEFVRWDVKAGDFLEEGLRIKAVYTPIITTNPAAYDSLMYNGTAQTLITAGVAKEGHIEYSLYPEEPESWSANLPTATNAGVYAVSYKLVREGHEDYMAGSVTAVIAKAPVTYVVPQAYDTLAYNYNTQVLVTAGQTNDGTFEYGFDPTLPDSWSADLPQAMNAGTYNVYFRVNGDMNHLDSTAVDPIAVTIAKAELTATADDKNVIYGDAVPEYSVTYAGWQGDDDAAVLTGDIAFACDYNDTTSVGTYPIVPSGVDAANYTITFVNGKVTVAKAESGCIAPLVYDTLVYNGANQTLIIAGQPMGGEMQYSLDTTVLDCWSTSLPQAKDAGTYNVYYRVKGDMNHNDHYYDLITVSIAKAALTATAEDKTVTYGDQAPEYTVVYAGWHGTDDASVLTGAIAYACDYLPTSNVDEYTITPSGVDAANYIITFVNGKVTVGKAALMITAEDKNVIYGDAVPTYTATYSGWKNSDDASVVSNLAYTCEYAPTSNVGEYAIVPSGAEAMNYAISYTNGKVTVSKAVLTITANDTVMIYGDEAPAFTASYSGWLNGDDESLVSGLAFTTPYQPGSPVGTYAIHPVDATALNYQIAFADGALVVNRTVVSVSGAEAHTAKFADGHANAEVTNQGVLNGVKLNDPLTHVTTAVFSSAEVSEHLTITLFYELTGDAALLANYDLQPTSEVFTTEGVIIEPFLPNNTDDPEDKESKVQEGIEVYAYGYCEGDNVGLKYHLNSGNPDQYMIEFEDSRFADVDWTPLDEKSPEGVIYITVPVDVPTGDYKMTVTFRDSRFAWLESQPLSVTFHVNLPETYVRPLFDNTIVLVDTCECFTDIQWYHRADASEQWQPISGANGHYLHVEGKLTGEYFVKAKMNGVETYTCEQTDMQTLYGAETNKQAKVKAYPNPVVDNTNVTIENSEAWEHNLRIVNLMGVELENTTFEGNHTVVEMSGYPQGNYMISVDGIMVKVLKQ